MAPACDLIRRLYGQQVLADRAYDADRLHDLIYEQGGEPVIPPRRHRKYQHRYDRIAYNQRWGMEASSPASSSGGASHPIRQARRQLPRPHQARQHHAMAQIV